MVATSCTLGPNYKRPAVALPASYRAPQATATDRSLADLAWFELFGDDTLTQLVRTALQQNFEVRIAAERVLQARAAYGITRADQVPSVGASADLAALLIAAWSEPGPSCRRRHRLQLCRSRLQHRMGAGRLGAPAPVERSGWRTVPGNPGTRRGVITTLVADVSETYLALRALWISSLDIARRTRDAGTDSLRLTETRRNGGVASALDVRQAEQLLFTATGQIASLEREIAQAEHALSLLLGQVPGDVHRGRALDQLQGPPAVPAGLPSDLLERRPDIRQAEQQHMSANAQIGAAKANASRASALRASSARRVVRSRNC